MKSWCNLSWREKCKIEEGNVNSLKYPTGYTFDVKRRVKEGKKEKIITESEVKMITTEKEAYERYNDMLDESYPLNGIHCNVFSILLKRGDEIAYNCGFNDFCDAEDIEIED